MTDLKDIHLSKTLSWLLRHGAIKEGLEIRSDGYIPVHKILQHKKLTSKYDLEDIKRVVDNNDKKRFSLRANNGVLEICANQGHSINIVGELNLSPLVHVKDIIHGTYFKNWEKIKLQGLNRMGRNHIHFSSGLPLDKTVLSGMRKDSQVFIYINYNLAIKDGIKFYKSVNDVILSPGDKDGFIKPNYFLKVVDNRENTL